ncbi:aldehyde oxidase GLOX1 [Prosopis cineraria]|uniref:aldehyde oxidase GLOX1 n=1 Tax=Prosopis cineraria TaxID=364024 RepID=UPI00240FDD95|nr:aldehyde oxidase GLOX1 [Prosopis cineraria]
MTLLALLIHFLFSSILLSAQAACGRWQLLQNSIGLVAMHMQLLHNDRVVIFDRTDFGFSNLSLPRGKCRRDPYEEVAKVDCTAHSIEYDVSSNTFRPLFVQTDVWCSSGSVAPDGRLVQTGGFNDGERAVRMFNPCPACDWQEQNGALAARRWYATNHILPDGRQIIVGGRRAFNYEFYPKTPAARNAYSLPFLVQTNDPGAENNLYPFVFLNVDGNLFIFANNRAILFDYRKSTAVKTFPQIPGGDPRCYPSTGSAVLLPLRNLLKASIEAEVLICGGAPRGSFKQANQGSAFMGALNTCARIKITDPKPQWVMENMPGARVMNDMLILPNGNILIINGAAAGTAGWELGRNPVLNPFVYKPDSPIGSRFQSENPSNIPRVYHSTAVLLRDGRVLVGGSNPHRYYNFTKVLLPTELRLEAYSPWYLEAEFSNARPKILSPASQTKVKYGDKLVVTFRVTAMLAPNSVSVTMLAPPFNTHSFSMNQRLLVLDVLTVSNLGKLTFRVEVVTPGSSVLAPPGFYLLFVVNREIPSEGIWLQIL